MNATVESILPLRLSLEDTICNPHEGHQGWARIVALANDGDHVLATCEGDPTALRLPAGRPVPAQRHVGSADDAEGEALVEEQMVGCYAGDMDAARAAHWQAHAQASLAAPPAADGPRPAPRYDGFYGGDLGHVVAAVGAVPVDHHADELRTAATQRRLADGAPHEVVDEASAAEANEAVDERMPGWFAGDLDYIVSNRES